MTGASIIGAGVALLRSNALLLGAAVAGLGLAALAGGSAIVRTDGTAGTRAILGGGLAVVVAGLAVVRDFTLLGVAALGDTIAAAGLGIWALRTGDAATGVTAFVTASAALTLGLSFLGGGWASGPRHVGRRSITAPPGPGSGWCGANRPAGLRGGISAGRAAPRGASRARRGPS